MTSPFKLNIGCGGTPLEGYMHLDKIPHPHVDILYDLESGNQMRWSNGDLVGDNAFDEMIMLHTFEHIHNVLPMMEELWRVAKPGCKLGIACPYGSTDNADEDPTHVRRVFANTFTYFSQAWYGKNDYGYRGDWDYTKATFILRRKMVADAQTEAQLIFRIDSLRNVVDEFLAELVAVKPLRKAGFAPVRCKHQIKIR